MAQVSGCYGPGRFPSAPWAASTPTPLRRSRKDGYDALFYQLRRDAEKDLVQAVSEGLKTHLAKGQNTLTQIAAKPTKRLFACWTVADFPVSLFKVGST